MSRVVGIRIDSVMALAFFVGSALAGLGGVLVGLNADISPSLGFDSLLVAMVAVIMGREEISRVMYAAVFLGFVQHFVAWELSTSWRNSIVFVILLVVLVSAPKMVSHPSKA